MDFIRALISILKKVANAAGRESVRLFVCVVLTGLVAGYFLPGLRFMGLFQQFCEFVWKQLPDDPLGLEVDAEMGTLLVMFVGTALIIRLLFALSPRIRAWLKSVLSNLEAPMESAPHTTETTLPMTLQEAAFSLRARSRQLRRTGQILIAAIVLLLLLSFMMFQGAESAAMGMYREFTLPLQTEAQNIRLEISNAMTRPPSKEPAAEKANDSLLAQRREELARLEARISELSPTKSLSLFLIFSLGTKVAAVIFPVFLIQLLGNLYRYHTRLAFFTDSRADVLEILGTSQGLTAERLVDLLVPEKTVEMDQIPNFPVLEQLRDVLKVIGRKD